MKATALYKAVKDDYVDVRLEVVNGTCSIHVEILKKDEHTRRHVAAVWEGLKEYLVANGVYDMYAVIEKDNHKLKAFAEYYGFTKEGEENSYEIWVAEII